MFDGVVDEVQRQDVGPTSDPGNFKSQAEGGRTCTKSSALCRLYRSIRAKALQEMEEERQRHIKARTKPTHRIGEEPSEETQCEMCDA